MPKDDVSIGIGLEVRDIDLDKSSFKNFNKEVNRLKDAFNNTFIKGIDLSKVLDSKLQKQFIGLEKNIMSASDATRSFTSTLNDVRSGKATIEKLEAAYHKAVPSIHSAQQAMQSWDASVTASADRIKFLSTYLERLEEQQASLDPKYATDMSMEELKNSWNSINKLLQDNISYIHTITAEQDKLRQVVIKNDNIEIAKGYNILTDEQVIAIKKRSDRLINYYQTLIDKQKAAMSIMKADSKEYENAENRLAQFETKQSAAYVKSTEAGGVLLGREENAAAIGQLQQLQTELQNTESIVGDLKSMLKTNEEQQHYKEVETAVQNTEEALKQAKYDAMPATFSEAMTKLKDTIKQKSEEAKQALMTKLGKPTTLALSTAWAALKGAVKGSLTLIKNGFELAGKAAKGLIKNISNIAKSMHQTSRSGRRSNRRLINTFLSLGVGVRSIFTLLRKFRTEIIKGMQSLATTFPEINTQISSMNQAFSQVKGSVVSAFQPIASAVMPILTQFAYMLSSVIDKIAEFFAVLTGQGFVYKATAAWDDYANSLEGAQKAQDKLASYDKLNVISKDSGSSKNTGMNNVSFAPAEITGAVSDFAEKVKAAWLTADFTEVGAIIANKFYTSLYDAYTILMPKLVEFVNKIALSLATLINGLVMDRNIATGIGAMVADLGNNLVSAINNFFTTTNWLNVGLFIGAAIDSLLQNINFTNIFNTIANRILAVFDFFRGMLLRVDWSKAAIDIATSFNTALRAMDVKKITETINTAVHSMFDTLIGFLATINWQLVGSKVRDFIANIDWAGVLNKLGNIIGQLVSGLIDFIKGLFTGESGEIKMGDAIAGLGQTIGNSFKGLLNGFVSGVNRVIATPFNKMNNILTSIRNAEVLGIKPFSWLGSLSVPKIPMLAQGAVIPPNKQFLAMLGDQKHGTNVEAPLDTIKQAVAEVLTNNGSNNEPIVLQLNSKVIARAVWDEEQKRYKQTGFAY